MKTSFLTNLKLKFLTVLAIFFAIGCGNTKSYIKDSEMTEMKMPFSRTTYPDSEYYFHSIQATEASGDRQYIMDSNRLAAIAALTSRIKGLVEADIESKGSVETGGGGSSTGITTAQKAQRIKAASKKVRLVSEKWFKKGTNPAGQTNWEYWAVYRIAVADIK